MQRYLFTLLLLVFTFSVFGQPIFKQINGPIIRNSNLETLKYGFSGGVWAAQLQEIDLDGDGILDLAIFDRGDYSVTTFLKKPMVGGDYEYIFAPSYQSIFPKMQDWFSLRDYNNDGKIDLFTSGNGGVMVYKNVGIHGARFELFTNDLQTDYGFGIKANLYVSNPDYPLLFDVDGDGDLDILAGSTGIGLQGFTVNWFSNLSIEKYGHADSLDFIIEDHCWGRFAEDIFNSNMILGLDSTCYLPVGPRPFATERVQHMGTTLCDVDMNGNGVLDLLIGDVSYSNIFGLVNTGTKRDARITAFDSTYPSYNVPIDVPYFPAGFRVDIDNNGKKELLIAPNEPFGDFTTNEFTIRKNSIWHYNNIGLGLKDSFELVSKNFLQRDMVDGYEFSAPILFDQNSDGLTDLLQLKLTDTKILTFHLFYNTGTNQDPIFTLVDTNWLNIQRFNLGKAIPTIGDLNGDQVPDLLLGFQNGEIGYLQGQIGAGYIIFNLVQVNFLTVDNFSVSPELFDYNQDGKLDLLVGKRNGKISLFRNDGTATSPLFTLVTNNLGQIDANPFPNFQTQTYPRIADFDQDGKPDIVVGTSFGYLHVYYNTAQWEDSNSVFQRNDSLLIAFETGFKGNAYLGRNCVPAIGHFNNDAYPDLMIGTDRGGLLVFENVSASVGLTPVRQISQLKVWPNPTNDVISIAINNPSIAKINIIITDLSGKTVLQSQNAANDIITISTQNLKSGIYLLRLVDENGNAIGYQKISIF